MKETKESIYKLQALMSLMQVDIAKALKGNIRAAQRSRTVSIILGKELLKFRKLSIISHGRKR